MVTSRDLRQRARAVMRVRMKTLILAALVFLLVDTLISFLNGELTGVNAWQRELDRRLNAVMAEAFGIVASGGDATELFESFVVPDPGDFYKGVFATVLAALLSLMSAPLTAGYTFHTLSESRGQQTTVMSVFYGFRMVWKTVVLTLLTGLLVMLGSILFIIPGIILSFRYSMALYILLDDPTKGPVQCMRESGQLMRGNKWRFCKLSLSFIGWMIVSSFVTSFVRLPLMELWLMPYIYLARAAFYNDLLAGATVGMGDGVFG